VLPALSHHALQQLANVLRVLGEHPGAVGELGLHDPSLDQGALASHEAGQGQEDWEEECEEGHGFVRWSGGGQD